MQQIPDSGSLVRKKTFFSAKPPENYTLQCKCGRVLYQGKKPPQYSSTKCGGCGRTINAKLPETASTS